MKTENSKGMKNVSASTKSRFKKALTMHARTTRCVGHIAEVTFRNHCNGYDL